MPRPVEPPRVEACQACTCPVEGRRTPTMRRNYPVHAAEPVPGITLHAGRSPIPACRGLAPQPVAPVRSAQFACAEVVRPCHASLIGVDSITRTGGPALGWRPRVNRYRRCSSYAGVRHHVAVAGSGRYSYSAEIAVYPGRQHVRTWQHRTALAAANVEQTHTNWNGVERISNGAPQPPSELPLVAPGEVVGSERKCPASGRCRSTRRP
jgi:hypothetical protein